MPSGERRLPDPRHSAAWQRLLPAMYGFIKFMDPLIRASWRASGAGLRNVVELRVVGRRSGVYRRVLLTLLKHDGQWFLGQPNGDVQWTRNLEAAGTAEIAFRDAAPVNVVARRLAPGQVRDRAIRSTGQHPFPANLVYRLARPHIRAVGVFFAIDPISQ
jgi:deazaflavin-dependent oxidoreductase (nitroreductase family)